MKTKRMFAALSALLVASSIMLPASAEVAYETTSPTYRGHCFQRETVVHITDEAEIVNDYCDTITEYHINSFMVGLAYQVTDDLPACVGDYHIYTSDTYLSDKPDANMQACYADPAGVMLVTYDWFVEYAAKAYRTCAHTEEHPMLNQPADPAHTYILLCSFLDYQNEWEKDSPAYHASYYDALEDAFRNDASFTYLGEARVLQYQYPEPCETAIMQFENQETCAAVQEAYSELLAPFDFNCYYVAEDGSAYASVTWQSMRELLQMRKVAEQDERVVKFYFPETYYQEAVNAGAGNYGIFTNLDDGDITTDGQVDVRDAVLMARVAVGDKDATTTQLGLEVADMNKDGAVNDLDLTMLLRKLAKLD